MRLDRLEKRLMRFELLMIQAFKILITHLLETLLGQMLASIYSVNCHLDFFQKVPRLIKVEAA